MVSSTSFFLNLEDLRAARTVELGEIEEDEVEEPVYTDWTWVWVGIMLTRVEAERAAS